MTEPSVEFKNISKNFGGIKALDNVSIELYPGQVVGLLGHNGAGKSTLIKILSGALTPDSGQIIIDGKEAIINNPRDSWGEQDTNKVKNLIENYRQFLQLFRLGTYCRMVLKRK